MQNSTNQNFYTVWDWFDAPYVIRSYAPSDWEAGTWIVRIDPRGEAPYTEFCTHLHPEWNVVQKEIDGRWYAFIQDTRNLPWPAPEVFYDNQPFEGSYFPMSLTGTSETT